MRRFRFLKRGWTYAAVVVTVVVTMMLGVAFADTVYDSLDNTVDATHEQMNLTFPGSPGSTTLKIQVDGQPDHPGCNIQGASHYLGLESSTSPTGIVDISWGNNDAIFNACTDTLTVIVTPLAVGATTVSFQEDAANSNYASDPNLTFSFAEATFDVTVTANGGSGPPPTGCDADPAAPAWAAAMLQKSGYKPKSSSFGNYVSRVANHMSNGATFEGFAKNAHPQYENSVHDWMQTQFGISLQSAAQSGRPGWTCTTV
jgi:hypothetical protein